MNFRGPPFPPRDQIQAHRANRRYPCPICGETDGQCIAIPADQRMQVWCIRGAGHEDGQYLQWGFRGAVWYFLLDDTGSRVRNRVTPAAYRIPLVDKIIQDRILRGVAQIFGLSDIHRDKLVGRGYRPTTIGPSSRFCFASLPASMGERAAVAAYLLATGAANGDGDILGTVGFERSHASHDMLMFLPRVIGAALLEFALDRHGIIWGFQYAPDDPPLRKGKPVKRLSPPRQEIYEQYHVVWPETRRADQLWYVEGIHKANLVADRLGVVAVCTFGVANTSALVKAAAELDPERALTHVIAIDQDHWEAREDVAATKHLAEERYAAYIARWNPRFSGPDDVLLAGDTMILRDAFKDDNVL